VVKGVLTSKKLGSPIDSELLIYCLQVDYILNCIWVRSLKSLCSSWTTPLLLSTMDTISTALVALLCTVDVIAHLSVTLLSSVVATPQPLDALLWFVYASPQSITDQLPPAPHGVDQLLSEFGGTRSELRLLSAFSFPTPSVSVPGSMTCCSVVSVRSHSGACPALVQLQISPGRFPLVH
jgi:hypothetical protein